METLVFWDAFVIIMTSLLFASPVPKEVCLSWAADELMVIKFGNYVWAYKGTG